MLALLLAAVACTHIVVVGDTSNHLQFIADLKTIYSVSLQENLPEPSKLNLVVFGSVSVAPFLEAGANLMLLGDSDLSVLSLRKSSDVVDVMSTDQSKDTVSTHSPADSFIDARNVFYQGPFFIAGKNKLLLPLLTASETAYADSAAGTDLIAVPAFVALNDARLVAAADAIFISDRFIDSSRTNANRKFAIDAAKWVFHNTGVLRIHKWRHHRVNEVQQRGVYRIQDKITVEAIIQEHKNNMWIPFTQPVQVSVSMIDPYIRSTMNYTPSTTESWTHSTTFTTQSQHGMFKFEIEKEIKGYTRLHVEDVVQIRTFNHDEYPRFMNIAVPYYVNVFGMMCSFLVFCAVWGWGRYNDTKVKLE